MQDALCRTARRSLRGAAQRAVARDAKAKCWTRQQGGSLGTCQQLLRGLLRDAEDLRADTLAEAVTVYLNEFSRLLAHQGSVPSEPSATAPADQRPRGNQPAAEPAQTNGAPPETPSKVAVASDRRRQRR